MALLDSASSQIVEINSLKKWHQISAKDFADSSNLSGLDQIHSTSPFEYDEEINKKVALWVGDITQLSCHAIVHSTNEHFNERALLSQRILTKAGPQLRKALKENVKICKTGDARITKGFDLPARFVVHTVGPKYNPKYHTAAESALYSCYSKVLHLIREHSLKTLGICAINTINRNYPRQAASHIALRVVRKFLEAHKDSVDLIVFVVEDVDVGIYDLLMPLYFPRSKQEEEYALYHLPQDIGGEAGEPVIPEREIRIGAKPMATNSTFEETLDLTSGLESSVAVGKTSFAKMQGDLDKRYTTGSATLNRNANDAMTVEMQRQHRYERMLRKSKTENWDDYIQARCLYVSGEDRFGRTVIVMVGKRFNAATMTNDRSIMYLVSLLDQVVIKDYIVIYFHTLSKKENHPSLGFVQYVYNLLDYKYKKNLKALYVVHANLWVRILTWWFTTFNASAIRDKVFCVGGVEFMKSVMPLQQLQVPSFVMDYDFKVNGVRYSEVQDARVAIDSL